MTSQELRFSLAERTPQGIKSTGDSGESVSIQDEKKVKSILDTIHNTKVEDHHGKTDWILLGYSGPDLKSLKLLGHGSGGLSELRSQPFPEDSVAYALLRVVDKIDDVMTTRFNYITWVGEKVNAVMNARIGVKKTAVTRVIGHYSVETLVSNKSELSDENILGRVQDASGSRSKVKEYKPPSKPQSTSPGGTDSTVFSYVPKGQGDQLRVQDDQAARDVIKSVRHGTGGLNWAMLTYSSPSCLVLSAKGTRGLSEVRSALRDNEPAYVFLSMDQTVDSTTMRRFIYIRWIPDGLPNLKKGKLTPHRGFVEDWLAPYHLNINAVNSEDISDKAVSEKLDVLKG
ncbi:uncharacterized protein LOC126322706 [Schistocerca gregaria]|uniref:uncharacterized protein LOC126322706 n=1 Tax=Schistocerca gregaria TaxID=7010 RepID=UPI00211E38B1|nr:uncharacterized protein LOC126322706 [Schistocerca gregaria]